MPRIAVALLGIQHPRGLPVATLVLPPVEAALHRDDVGVTELLERLGCERGAIATGAVDEEGRVLARDAALDVRLELAAGDEQGAGNRALFVFVGFADVEQ